MTTTDEENLSLKFEAFSFVMSMKAGNKQK